MTETRGKLTCSRSARFSRSGYTRNIAVTQTTIERPGLSAHDSPPQAGIRSALVSKKRVATYRGHTEYHYPTHGIGTIAQQYFGMQWRNLSI